MNEEHLATTGDGNPLPVARSVGGFGLAPGEEVVAAVGFLVALFSTAHRARLVVTDEGMHVRQGDGRDEEFIPWSDVISIEPAMPFTAMWRVTLRPGAPGVSQPRWHQRIFVRGSSAPDTCVVGDESLYDFTGARLEAIQAAHDRWLEAHLADPSRRAP